LKRELKFTEVDIFEKHKENMIKLNYCAKRDDYIKGIQEKQKKIANKVVLKEKVSYLAQIGIFTTEKDMCQYNESKNVYH